MSSPAILLTAFLDQGFDVEVKSALIDPIVFLREVKALLRHSPNELMNAGRLSFGSEKTVTYPESREAMGLNLGTDTIILQSLESHPGSIAGICSSLTASTTRLATCSAYLSSRTNNAFGWHIDQWDSMIIQLAGSKTFHFRNRPPAQLTPGDVLLFRQGVEHLTESGPSSIHVSIALHKKGQ